MSTALLIAPHADDESLFAAYLAQRYSAHIVVVYDEGRENELAQAAQWLGCTYEQLGVSKQAVRHVVEHYLRSLSKRDEWDTVIVPYVEDNGHEEHNLVGTIAAQVFSPRWIVPYRTYAPRGRRSIGTESFPGEPVHVSRKLAALSCYRSQIEDPATGPWFSSLLDMREWTA